MLLLVKRSFPLNSKFDNLNIWKKERCNVCNVLAVLGWNTKYLISWSCSPLTPSHTRETETCPTLIRGNFMKTYTSFSIYLIRGQCSENRTKFRKYI